MTTEKAIGQDLAEVKENAVAQHQDPFLDMLSQMARDPNVDPAKMHSILDLKERQMNKQAELEFNSDFAKLQADLPRISKDAKITHNGKLINNYATYEQIDTVIRPLLIKHGFGLRYNSEPMEGKVIITATLSHRGGHSITDKIPLGFDSSGAKNNVQGVGSTITYGKRYLVGMLLNLVFEGEDDDGVKSGYKPLTDAMAEEIKDLIRETGTDTIKFLNMMTGTASVEEIDLKDYNRVVNVLKAKKGKAAP